MNKQETAAILRILRSVWKETAIDGDTVTAWEWAMEDVPVEAAQHAVKVWLRSGKPFFPKPSDLREILANDATGPDDLAETAWNEVRAEASRVGYNRPPEFRNGRFLDRPEPRFSSPLIAEAVASVGWPTVCTGDEAEARKAFIFAYREIRKRTTHKIQRGDISGPALPGGDVRALGKGVA